MDESAPLTDDEKRKIGRAFRELREAIWLGDEDIVDVRYQDFRWPYRGKMQQLVDQLSIASDRRQWVVQVAHGLKDEIGSDFYVPYDLDGADDER